MQPHSNTHGPELLCTPTHPPTTHPPTPNRARHAHTAPRTYCSTASCRCEYTHPILSSTSRAWIFPCGPRTRVGSEVSITAVADMPFKKLAHTPPTPTRDRQASGATVSCRGGRGTRLGLTCVTSIFCICICIRICIGIGIYKGQGSSRPRSGGYGGRGSLMRRNTNTNTNTKYTCDTGQTRNSRRWRSGPSRGRRLRSARSTRR
jgi:hypothetical protein